MVLRENVFRAFASIYKEIARKSAFCYDLDAYCTRPKTRSFMNRVESNQWLRLVWTEGMTFSFTKDLLKAFGLPEKIFAASQAELSDVVPFPIAKRLAAKVDPLIEARLVSALDWLEA
ncbi:MAG TPA: hypothetical protein DCW60_01685, partial [Sutterella sp.]|nr:hypothetical protein [Sutterella sp.]